MKNRSKMDHGAVYVLLLKENKYYVGHTTNLIKLQENLRQKNIRHKSPWVTKYEPIGIVCTVPGDRTTKDIITLQVMELFGWENVRGGKWCSIELLEPPQELGNPERINSCACTRCHRLGHMQKHCISPVYLDGDAIMD